MTDFRALALLGSIVLSSLAGPQVTDKTTDHKDHSDLEKQLWELDQKWAAHPPNEIEVLDHIWTSQFFEVGAGGRIQSKADLIEIRRKALARSGSPSRDINPRDNFELRAVYGNVALATDHTVLRTGTMNNGQDISGEFRVLRIFVKEGSEWKVAGAALVPITAPPRSQGK